MLPELEHDLVRPVCTMCACYRYSGASVPRYCGKRKGHRYLGTGYGPVRMTWCGHEPGEYYRTQIYIVRTVLSTVPLVVGHSYLVSQLCVLMCHIPGSTTMS